MEVILTTIIFLNPLLTSMGKGKRGGKFKMGPGPGEYDPNKSVSIDLCVDNVFECVDFNC